MTITNQTLIWLAPIGGAAAMTVTTLITNYFDTHRPAKVVSALAGQGRNETVEGQGASGPREVGRMFGAQSAADDQTPSSDDVAALRQAVEKLAQSVEEATAEAGPPQDPGSR